MSVAKRQAVIYKDEIMYSEATPHGCLADYLLKILKNSWEIIDFGFHLQYKTQPKTLSYFSKLGTIFNVFL